MRFAALAVLLACAACTSPAQPPAVGSDTPSVPAAPDASSIRLTTSLETVYYTVDGRTTTEIFDSVEARGPSHASETTERFATGLTDADRSLNYVVSRSGFFGSCGIESADIDLSVVVTLPKHSDPQALSPDLQGRWQAFEDAIAAHEQRHVDIHTTSVEAFKRKLATDYSGRFADCDALTSRLIADWELEQDFDRRGQDEFHVAEEQRSDRLRGAAQLQIDEAEAEQARLRERLDRGSSGATQLRSQITAEEEAAAVYQSQMDAIRASYPDLALPPDVFDTYEEIRAEWNAHNDRRDQVVDELNQAVRSRNQTVEEFNRLLGHISGLREELAWVS